MKRTVLFTFFAFVISVAAPLACAQETAAAPGNPVSDTVKRMVASHAKSILAAAEEMPADKYSYKPTPQQITFGHLVMHLAQSNTFLCSAIAGTKPPEQEKLTETDPKDKLVAALKSSLDYCTGVLDKTDDSKVSEMISTPRGSFPRAAAMITLVADLYDHYSAEAMYLRLNGMLPPTAQSRNEK